MAKYVLDPVHLYFKNPDGSFSGGWVLVIVGIVWIASGARMVWRSSGMSDQLINQFKLRLPLVTVRIIGVAVIVVGLLMSGAALASTPGNLY